MQKNRLTQIIFYDIENFINVIDFETLRDKSILITGASGLLGTYFLATLCMLYKRGVTPSLIVAVTNSDSNYLIKEYEDSLPILKAVQADLSSAATIDGFGSFDFIIHAAGYGQPNRFMKDQIKTIQLNTTATLALFNVLNSNGRFLFLSSSEVYNGLNNPPFNESQIGTTNTTNFRSSYIEGKRCGEAICHAQRSNGISASSARLALAYGPGTKAGDSRVINSFIERALKESEIKLLDHGSAMRTYCYVADAVEILWQILLHGTESLYNVGGKSRVTIAELARQIGAYVNVPVRFPEQSQELQGAPSDVFLDMTRVQTEFNKVAYISLQDGLSRTIAWQKILYGLESELDRK